MGHTQRLAGYLRQNGPNRSSSQRKRLDHKSSHAVARTRGPRPVTPKVLAKTPPGTPQPRHRHPSRGFLRMLGGLRPADRDRALARWLERRHHDAADA
jgi:hypothetical protein